MGRKTTSAIGGDGGQARRRPAGAVSPPGRDERPGELRLRPVIRVVGCGGTGGAAIDTMIRGGLLGVDFAFVNTEEWPTSENAVPTTLIVEPRNGPRAGSLEALHAPPELVERIRELVDGADIVFIVAGLGGRTGGDFGPLVAEVARIAGALSIALVTTPFQFEGSKRARRAQSALDELSRHADTLITIPNHRIRLLANEDLSLSESYRKADGVILDVVALITGLIETSGIVNVDLEDFRAILQNAGRALFGVGLATGASRSTLAAERAVSFPLFESTALEGATSVLINVEGPSDMKMREIQEAATVVQKQVHADADIVFGASINDALGENLRVTVLATNFLSAERRAPPQVGSPAGRRYRTGEPCAGRIAERLAPSGGGAGNVLLKPDLSVAAHIEVRRPGRSGIDASSDALFGGIAP